MQKDCGEELTIDIINKQLLSLYNIPTCICFMGGDIDHKEIIRLAKLIKKAHPKKKVAMYSGLPYIDNELVKVLDYYKVGPYIPEKGPLNQKTTNQRFYKIEKNQTIDITYKFQKEKV